jgi:uncharacterized protein with HEPN domain
MSKRPVSLLIEDICEAIEKVELYTEKLTLELFRDDTKTVDAVVRNLEIIGEAASRLPYDFKQKYSEITWNKIIGLRHRIVHEYFGVDIGIVWQIIKKDFPAFKIALFSICDNLKS